MGRKRSTRRQRKPKRKTFRQRGGNRGLLDNADAPQVAQGAQVDFNVRFQPTVKANEFGPTFTAFQTAHEPYPVWTAPKPPTMYTIICWDPDSPKKSFLHWLIVNCAAADNADGKVVNSWAAPSPPPGSGEHRYILGLFKQDGPIDVPEFTDRTGFNLIEFAKKYNITALAYKGFRVKAADSPPPASANPLPNANAPPANPPPANAPPANAPPANAPPANAPANNLQPLSNIQAVIPPPANLPPASNLPPGL